MIDQVLLQMFRDTELSRPRHAEPGRLTRFGRKVYAQNDEDGILAEIFRRIGVTTRSFVEFGVGAGLECNSLWLLLQGWHGLWIEADEGCCKSLSASHARWLADGSLTLKQEFLTAGNINEVIGERFSGEIDLLSIDLDSNDYWVWKAIEIIKPRTVVIEYNANWPPPAAISVAPEHHGPWNGTNYFGASLSALAQLGAQKGYDLVGCSLSGVNAFFVRRDLVADRFHAPGSAEEHYEPARYFLSALTAGHRAGVGDLVTFEPQTQAQRRAAPAERWPATQGRAGSSDRLTEGTVQQVHHGVADAPALLSIETSTKHRQDRP